MMLRDVGRVLYPGPNRTAKETTETKMLKKMGKRPISLHSQFKFGYSTQGLMFNL